MYKIKIISIIILAGLLSCNSPQKNQKAKSDSLIVNNDTLVKNLPIEYILKHNDSPNVYDTVIQLFNSYDEISRNLIAKYKIRKNIFVNWGNLEWVLISKKYFYKDNDYPVFKIHFISYIGNKMAREYCDFVIPNDSILAKKADLISVFKIKYNDRQIGIRKFIVVISKIDNKYYNNIFEITCSSKYNCNISELFVCNDFPIEKNHREFKKVFAKYMSTKHKCDTPKTVLSNSDFDGTHFRPENKTILYFSNTFNKKSINKLFDGTSLYNGKYVFNSLNMFYTIGKEIKTKLYLNNVFFRKLNGISQICFIYRNPEDDLDDSEFSYIQKFNLPKESTILSVFGYSCKRDIGYNLIVVISKTNTGKYRTSLYRESYGNRYCSMEQVIFKNQDKLFKDVKKYEDFIKIFPKIYKENNEYYTTYE